MGTQFFTAISMFPVEILAYPVSMVCAGNWPGQLYLYKFNNIGLSI